MLKNIIFVAVVLSTTGCALIGPKAIDPSDFHRVNIPMNNNPPTQAQLAGARTKVIVFRTEDKADLAKKMNIGEASTGAIEGYVTASAELIDRSLAKKLKSEIMLAEVKGSGSWGGPNVADYAVMSDITLAKASSKFSEGYYYKNKKGENIYVSPSCSYSAKIEGNMKVYKLPSLTLVKGMKISGRKSESEDVRKGYWYSRQSRCDNSDTRTSGLLQHAASNAIDRERTELQNNFSAKGYITERRSGEDGDIFKITLGSDSGADKGLDVRIQREETVVNPLTKKEESEIIPLGSGEITDQVESHYAWIFVKDKDTANKLMLGDTVIIIFEKSLWESVNNLTKG